MTEERTLEDIARDSQAYWELLRHSGYSKEKFYRILRKNNQNNRIPKELKRDLSSKWIGKTNQKNQKLAKNIDRFIKYEMDNNNYLPKLKTSHLICFVCGLKRYLNKQSKVLTENDIEKIFRRHQQLTREERKILGLPVDSHSHIARVDDYSNMKPFKPTQQKKYSNKEDFIAIIKDVIIEELKNPLLASSGDYIDNLYAKLKEFIESIQVQSGYHNVYRSRDLLGESDMDKFSVSLDKIYSKIFSKNFIYDSIKTIAINQQLTNRFPLTLENIKVEKQPFQSAENTNRNEIVNQYLLEYDPQLGDVEKITSILQRKQSYKVTIEFCLNNKNENIYFTEEVKGSSSIVSLIRKALNRAMFWDVNCWKSFYPVVQEVMLEEKIYGMDTLATCQVKSRIRALDINDIKHLLNEKIYCQSRSISKEKNTNDTSFVNKKSSTDFDCYIEGSDIVEGTYCSFDLVEAIAKSGFYARLGLLQEVNISQEIYLDDLKRRIEETKAFEKGLNFLHSYPFSLLVMEEYLKERILNKYFNEKRPIHKFSNLAFQAIFAIIRGYINEGLYVTTRKYLDIVANREEQLNHFLKADYYLCEAEYNFIAENPTDKVSRKENIDNCLKNIELAEQELKIRSLEFLRIGELSQGNLSPLNTYWAKIYALKGKINLFFPFYISNQNNNTKSILSLVVLGDGRIHAAMDGNAFLVAQISAYQSWAYIIEAYLGDGAKKLDRENCISWAKKLVNHALVGFQAASQRAYSDYQQAIFVDPNSADKDSNEWKNITVENPPFLRLNSGYLATESSKEGYWKEILPKLVNRTQMNSEKGQQGYCGKHFLMFGQHATYYFFAYAMQKLGEDYLKRQQEDATRIDDKNIRYEFIKAYDYFYYAFSIAYGGAELKMAPKELRRDTTQQIAKNAFNPDGSPNFIVDNANVSALKSLYFHRIVELVDLSRIFAALSISIAAQTEKHLEIGRKLLGGVEEPITPISSDFRGITNGQVHYNIHLSGRFQRLKEYLLENCLQNPLNLSSVQDFCIHRDKKLRKVFEKMRGD